MSLNRFHLSLLICAVLQIGSVLFSTDSFAQHTSELGIGIGATNYKGEVSPNYDFLKNRPAFTIFYRKDVSAPVTLRAALTAGMIRAQDVDIDQPLHQHRRADVITNLAELSGALEYNFLDYYDEKRSRRWSPYLMIGLAVAHYNNRVVLQDNEIKPFENAFVFAIPVGVGIKYALSNHWNLGVEFGARKTFSDRIDYRTGGNTRNNVPDELPYTNPYDRDWYYYNGISLSYTFYKIPCPKFYNPSRRRFLIF